MNAGAPISRVTLLCLFALTVSACSADDSHSQQEAESRLAFANWAGEIGATTIEDFERTHGIEVDEEVISDNVVLQTKLLTGNSGSDVVVPTANFLPPLIAAGALTPLDRSKLPNWRNLDPGVLKQLEALDPGNRYAIPYVWGTYGITYDSRAAKAALGHDPGSGYELLFDVNTVKAMAPCGIAWPDGGGMVMTSLALLSAGIDPSTQRVEDLKSAETLLMRVRPYVRYIDSSKYDGDLASGEICVAAGPSGDMLRARDAAATGPRPRELRYLVPSTVGLMWIDVLVIPAAAPHSESAYRFMNYLLDPAVMAGVTNGAKFANAVPSSIDLLDPAIRGDADIRPPPEVIARLRVMPEEKKDFVRERTRMWTRVRLGRPSHE